MFDVLSSFLYWLLIVAAIFLVIFIIFALGRVILGLLVNSILGLLAIYILNVVFGLGIAINLLTLILVAIFGLPAVAIIVILKLFGISI